MKFAKLPKWSLWAIGAVIAAFVIAIALYVTHGKSEPAEKHVVEMSPMWPYVDLDSATNEAEFIVHGKVTDISETKVHELVDSLGKTHKEYYKDITLEVIEQLKGADIGPTVIYDELGGETEDLIYILAGYEPLKMGEEVILFATEHGTFLSPVTLIRITDGSIRPAPEMLPESMVDMYSDDASNTLSVSDYLDAVEAKLN